jgi:Flp pilus assembly protein TadB
MKSPISHADASLCGTTPDGVARLSLMASVTAFCGSLAATWIAKESGFPVGTWLGATIVVGISVAFYVLPISKTKKKATQLRRDMNAALAAYLDLVNVLLAGGAGMETALLGASTAGDGWCFDEFRMALARARSSRVSFWDELRTLGERYEIDPLIDVAHSVQLAGEHGARVRLSLQTKAASLRARNLAAIEYEAQQSTEHMGVPMVMLFVGFIILIGYPAFASTLGVL